MTDGKLHFPTKGTYGEKNLKLLSTFTADGSWLPYAHHKTIMKGEHFFMMIYFKIFKVKKNL